MQNKQLVFNFGRKGKANFIQEANRRSVLKGTIGSFGKWCRSQGLAVDGKVTLKCIKRAKSSGNNLLIKRATYAKNIGGYLGATHKKRGARKTGVKRRGSRFGNIMDPANYYGLIGEYNDELTRHDRYTRGRYLARYRYYQNMLDSMYADRVIPINYLVQSVDALNPNDTTNKIKRYVIIRRILKIIRENMNEQEATRIANRTSEPLPRNLRRFGNNFGNSMFGNTDDHVDDDAFVYLEREKRNVLPRIQRELDLAQQVVDNYPKDDVLKKRAKGSINSISKRLRKAFSLRSITSFITAITALFMALGTLFWTISQMHSSYHGLRADSKTFRNLSNSTIERPINAYNKMHEKNEKNFQNFEPQASSRFTEVNDSGTQT